jgi:outer membrane cobalamin receptor
LRRTQRTSGGPVERGGGQRRAIRATGILEILVASSLLYAVLARADEESSPAQSAPENLVVTGIRMAELPDDPSSFTTVLETDAFRGEGKSLEDMLAESVGVQVRRFGGPGQPAELSIRGSTGSQVVILLDGVRLNTAQSGSVDLSTIPAALVQRIEVSRGGASVQTGSDAIGGVVNIVTRRVSDQPTTNLKGGAGSFGTWQASATQTGRIGGFELVAGYDFFTTDGDFKFQTAKVEVDGVEFPELVGKVKRVNNETENHSGLVKVAREFGETLRVSFTDDFFYGSAGRPGPALGPGGLALQSQTAHQRRTRNLSDLALEATDVAGWGVDAALRVYHRFDRSRYRDPNPPIGAPVSSDNRNHAFGGRGSIERSAEFGFTEHRASLGVELRRDWLDAKHASNRDRNTYGVFFQDELDFFDDRLTLIPAFRFDRTDGFGSEWLPRLGVVVTPWPWLRLKGNVERAYRVPNFDELYFNEGSLRGNPSLDPEESWNADLGVQFGFERVWIFDDISFEVAGFHNEINDSIVFQLVSLNVIAATNTGDATMTGVELAGGLRLFDWIEFSGNYTWLDSEDRRTKKSLPGRADEEYLLRLAIGPSDGLFKLVGERQHTSSIPVRSGGASKLPSRTIYNASLTFDFARLPGFRERWRLFARRLAVSVIGTNLADRSVRDALGFPQPGRTLLFQGEVAW